MGNGMFGSREKQCEKCHTIYRMGESHGCPLPEVSKSEKSRKEVMQEEEHEAKIDTESDVDGSFVEDEKEVEEAPKKTRKSK